jgi:membrane dipeptidase
MPINETPHAGPTSPEAAQLHRQALVWDQTLPWTGFGDPRLKKKALDRYRASGVDFVSLTVATDGVGIDATIRVLAAERAALEQRSDAIRFCYTADDILAARAAGLLGVNFHFQGTDAFERSLDMVDLYYRLGVRHALMAYNQKNAVGDGCHERTDGGLSRYGIALVREMNRVGMIVDCSHTGYRTTMDVFEHAQGPVIFSHSNVRALHDHPRNIRDEQISACARTDGVIGINGIGIFLGQNDASTARLVEHIDYVVQHVGARHVGIGLDWVYDLDSLLQQIGGHAQTYPDAAYQNFEMRIAAPEQWPEITGALLARGYGNEDIAAILGGNWLRVARQVWK